MGAREGKADQVADTRVHQSEEATGSFVRERALAMVTTNLAPTPFLLLPFTLLVSSLLRGDAAAARLGWWVVVAVVSTALVLLAIYRYYMRGHNNGTPRSTQLLIGAAFASIGLLFGMCPWVAGGKSAELVLLFALFPSTASAVTSIVTAGRRDMYLAFIVPLILVSSLTLIAADDSRLRSLGFLTTFSADEARAQFATLLEGDYRLARRALLDCKTGPRRSDVALNDVLIKDAKPSRIVRLEVFANDQLVTDYTCDGLIFSTPTGSTAYNLAAGGPIVHPAAGVITMTPICPHTLSNRTIIFRDDVKLTVHNRSEGARLLVAMDGQRNMVVTAGAPVEISISARTLSLAQRRDYSHFEVMRAKLKWSGGFLEKK